MRIGLSRAPWRRSPAEALAPQALSPWRADGKDFRTAHCSRLRPRPPVFPHRVPRDVFPPGMVPGRPAANRPAWIVQKRKDAPIWLKQPPRSEEHTSELQSLMRISYAVFCLKKKTKHNHKKSEYNK